jgi:hypothetical protein
MRPVLLKPGIFPAFSAFFNISFDAASRMRRRAFFARQGRLQWAGESMGSGRPDAALIDLEEPCNTCQRVPIAQIPPANLASTRIG